MNKYFSLTAILLFSLLSNSNTFAAVVQRSADTAIQQAEMNALKSLENQLPREKPSSDSNNIKEITPQVAQSSQGTNNVQSNIHTPSASNPATSTTKPQSNPWVKPNPWADQAKQNPWANQPLPAAPNTAPINQPNVSTLPPPPNIFAVPSATPVPPQTVPGSTAHPSNTPNAKP